MSKGIQYQILYNKSFIDYNSFSGNKIISILNINEQSFNINLNYNISNENYFILQSFSSNLFIPFSMNKFIENPLNFLNSIGYNSNIINNYLDFEILNNGSLILLKNQIYLNNNLNKELIKNLYDIPSNLILNINININCSNNFYLNNGKCENCNKNCKCDGLNQICSSILNIIIISTTTATITFSGFSYFYFFYKNPKQVEGVSYN